MRKARIVIGMVGLDQHEVGAVAVSRILMEAGMEVIYLGRFQTPESLVKAGIQEAADAIGISCHSWEYLYFMPDIIELLDKQSADIPVVVGGSVITGGDRAPEPAARQMTTHHGGARSRPQTPAHLVAQGANSATCRGSPWPAVMAPQACPTRPALSS